mgnify:CR=1 FL=1
MDIPGELLSDNAQLNRFVSRRQLIFDGMPDRYREREQDHKLRYHNPHFKIGGGFEMLGVVFSVMGLSLTKTDQDIDKKNTPADE